MSNNEARQGLSSNLVTAQTLSTSPQSHQFNMLYNQTGQEVSFINRQNEYRTIALGQPLLISAPNLPTTMFCNQARYNRQNRYQNFAMGQPLPTNAQYRPSNTIYNQPGQSLRSINNRQNDYRNFTVALPTSARTRLYNQARQGLSSINNNPNEQQQFSMARPFPSDVRHHPCHFCDKVFINAESLGRHMKIHHCNNWIQARERNLSATLTISSVEYALQREELRKKAQRPISSSSLDYPPTFGTSTSVTYPQSVPTPIPFLGSSSLNVHPKTETESINYHTRPFLDKPEKRVKIESVELSEGIGKKSKKGQEDGSEKLDLTLRL